MTRAQITCSTLLLLTLTACGFGGWDDKKDGDDEPQRPKRALLVRTTTPQRRSMERRLPMTGKMTPLLEAEVVARVAGVRVLKLLKDVGDEVAADEVIAHLETTELEHTLAEAENSVAEAQEKIDESEFTVTDLRAEKLAHMATVARKKQVWERLKAQTRGVPLDEIEAAQYEYDTEKARQKRYEVQIKKARASRKVFERAKKAAELARDKAKRDLGHSRVTTPIAGIVTERLAQIGQVTTAGQSLYRIYDPKRLVARTKLAQHHLRHVRENQIVRFRGDAYPDITFIAEVALIEPQVDSDNAMVAVRLKLAADKTLTDPANAPQIDRPEYANLKAALKSGRTLKPGMFVSGQIVLENREDILSVPRKAIAYLRGQPYVYVVEPREPAVNGDDALAQPEARWRVRRLYFREGLADDGRVEFVPLSAAKTLGNDDIIVLVGQDRLKDGDPVRIETDPATKPASATGAVSNGNGKD